MVPTPTTSTFLPFDTAGQLVDRTFGYRKRLDQRALYVTYGIRRFIKQLHGTATYSAMAPLTSADSEKFF